jgi:hypothetical protein
MHAAAPWPAPAAGVDPGIAYGMNVVGGGSDA